jgi:hypothetical protein
MGAGGNTNCVWGNPDADSVTANAGVYECKKDRYCQRPVKCRMTSGGQSFEFSATAKCAVGGGQTCEMDANTCAGQNFNDKRGVDLPTYDPSKQTTGAK